MKVHVEKQRNFTEEVKYVWRVWALNRETNIQFVDSPALADITIDLSSTSGIPLATNFYESISNRSFQHDRIFQQDYWIRDKAGSIDYIATAFYMINSLQEFEESDHDEIGRFQYEHSYQHRFSCVTKNIVQECFERMTEIVPGNREAGTSKRKSAIYLTHDIDSVNGAWLQDGFYLLKKGRPDKVLGLIFNSALAKPDWLNMDKIMNIEDEYSLKSTFFWLVNKGRVNKREVNADYSIHSPTVREQLARIEKKGWQNQLHKSISAETLKEEANKSGLNPVANRYHYLKFTLPNLYDKMEESGLRMDASLGFAEMFGFRNSYGLPFVPFNLEARKAYSFVETPLHIMDGTFQRYMNIPKERTAGMIIDFLEANKFNCVLSLLWHNTFFTEYKFKGYLDIYKKVLGYLVDNKVESIDTNGIIQRYSFTE